MVRLDYWGSFFTNDIQTLAWDNPIRATDFNNGLLPPNGPYDPSGYSNGNGPALGQEALWPSNNLNSFGTTGMYQVDAADHGQRQPAVHVHAPERGAAAVDDEYQSINNPTVLARSRTCELPRSSAEAAVGFSMNWLLNFNSRPFRFVTIQARYRYNEHDNKTPHLRRAANTSASTRSPRSSSTIRIRPTSRASRSTSTSPRKNFDVNGTFALKAFGAFASATPTRVRA